MGSPQTHKDKWAHHDCHKVIVQYFDTREEAADVELRVIKHVINKPGCLNEGYGSKGFSIEVCRQAGKRGGRAAVESGQLAAARLRQLEKEAWRAGVARAAEVNKKGVVLTSLKDGTEFYFEGIRIAARALSLRHEKLCRVLKGKRKSTGGYTVRYL